MDDLRFRFVRGEAFNFLLQGVSVGAVLITAGVLLVVQNGSVFGWVLGVLGVLWMVIAVIVWTVRLRPLDERLLELAGKAGIVGVFGTWLSDWELDALRTHQGLRIALSELEQVLIQVEGHMWRRLLPAREDAAKWNAEPMFATEGDIAMCWAVAKSNLELANQALLTEEERVRRGITRPFTGETTTALLREVGKSGIELSRQIAQDTKPHRLAKRLRNRIVP
jgi:hypothetical protein